MFQSKIFQAYEIKQPFDMSHVSHPSSVLVPFAPLPSVRNGHMLRGEFPSASISTAMAYPVSKVIVKNESKSAVEPVKVDFSVSALSKTDSRDALDVVEQGDKGKCRGRPSAQYLRTINDKELNSQSYVCLACKRSFPRKKSLDTHSLTHSKIKPYKCDFPGCTRSFKQSGQLKTHFRLHTGEKPFRCVFPLCTSAFTHANRKCQRHPDLALKRVVYQQNGLPNMCTDTRLRHEGEQDGLDLEQIRIWLRKQTSDQDCLLRASLKRDSFAPSEHLYATVNVRKISRKPLASLDFNLTKSQRQTSFVHDGCGLRNAEGRLTYPGLVNDSGEYMPERRQETHCENEAYGQPCIGSLEMPIARKSLTKLDTDSAEESRKRLLSALALVELYDNNLIKCGS